MSPALRRHVARAGAAFVVACAYGPAIWLVMSLVVIPLVTGRPPTVGWRWWVQLVAHVPVVTLPLVFTVRHALEPGRPGAPDAPLRGTGSAA